MKAVVIVGTLALLVAPARAQMPCADLQGEAVRLCIAAERGSADARRRLGLMFEHGEGVARDHDRAAALLRAAADQNNAAAQFELARLYQLGRGVPADDRQAVAWLTRAAARNHAGAIVALGQAYEDGAGVAQDWARAVEHYRRAAALGNAEARFGLANLLRIGRGAPADPVEATRLLRVAADQGHAPAQNAYAIALRDGQGVPRDDAGAARYFRRAADQGLAAAQLNLAEAYAAGRGVARDRAEAERWYRRLAETEAYRIHAEAGLRRLAAPPRVLTPPPVARGPGPDFERLRELVVSQYRDPARRPREAEPWAEVEFVDLNDDGQPEAIARPAPWNIGYCRSGGCAVDIWAIDNGRPRHVGAFLGERASLAITAQVENGWRVLRFGVRFYHFRDDHYE